MAIFPSVCENIQTFKRATGTRTDEFAQRLGTSLASAYRYEKGDISRIETICQLSTLMNVSVATLLGASSEQYSNLDRYLDRMWQIDQLTDRAFRISSPLIYQTTSDAYDLVLRQIIEEIAVKMPRDEAAIRKLGNRLQGLLEKRKRLFRIKQPSLTSIVIESRLRDLLAVGVAGGVDISSRLRAKAQKVAADEAEGVAKQMEECQDGIRIGFLDEPCLTSSFELLYEPGRTFLVVNPLALDGNPLMTMNVAMIATDRDTLPTYSQIADAAWERAIKGKAGAAKIRAMIAS